MNASVGIYLMSCGHNAIAGCCRWHADVR